MPTMQMQNSSLKTATDLVYAHLVEKKTHAMDSYLNDARIEKIIQGIIFYIKSLTRPSPSFDIIMYLL